MNGNESLRNVEMIEASAESRVWESINSDASPPISPRSHTSKLKSDSNDTMLDAYDRKITISGDTYSGKFTMTDGKPTGEATVTYANGNVYVGRVQSGYPHGCGKMTYARGDTYEGDWRYGKQSGRGTFTSIHNEEIDLRAFTTPMA